MAQRVVSRVARLAGRLGAAAQPGGVVGCRRHHHTRRPGAAAAEVMEVEAQAGASTSAEAGAIKKRLEEAIDGAMARMSEPEWAPFRPGTSYYAPPRPAGAARTLLELASRGGLMPQPMPRALYDDEARAAVSDSRGYPCSTYFIDARFPDEQEESSMNDVNQAEEE